MKKAPYRLIARRLRVKMEKLLAAHNFKVICITGSTGKTSAKLAISKLLATKYRTYISDDSYNGDIGVPLALFGLKAPQRLSSVTGWQKVFSQMNKLIRNFPYEVVVIEIAEDEQAMMQSYVELLHPDFFVVTGASLVHMARMDSWTQIEDDIISLASTARRVIYNTDCARFTKAFGKQKHNLSFGLKRGNTHFGQIKRNREGYLKGELVIGSDHKLLLTQQVSTTGLYSLLAASLIGHEFEIETGPIIETLSALEPARGRMRLLPGLNHTKLIDDTYNSSPAAALAALNTLAEFKGRKIAVLGSMNELGSHSPKAHTEVGTYAAKIVDLLVTVGAEAERYLSSAAVTAGLPPNKVKIFRTPYEAGHFLAKQLIAGDTVLLKGSQDGVFCEETSRILLAKHIDPTEVLVRQTDFWRRKRKRAFAQ